jgi:hypothetical protein
MTWLRGLSGWRRVLVLVVAATVIMAAGAVLAGLGDTPPQGTRRPATTPPAAERASTAGSRAEREAAPPSTGPGPFEVSGGVGVGFRHDEAGAVAAALSYATAPQSWLYLSDEAVADSVAAIVAPDAREEIVGDVVEEVGLLRDGLAGSSGTVWYVVSPLASRVESYDDDRAVVRVWTVRVLSADGVAVPQSGWQTLTFHLVWLDDDWKIAAMEETDGPTPQLEVGLQPWAADYLDERLAGFSRVGATP